MWLSEYVAGIPHNSGQCDSGVIRSASGGGVGISASRDYHSAPLLSPAGIAYIPPSGSRTVVLPVADGAVCLGVVSAPDESLEPGELMLYSAGGASVVLKNDGRVLINGREVA